MRLESGDLVVTQIQRERDFIWKDAALVIREVAAMRA